MESCESGRRPAAAAVAAAAASESMISRGENVSFALKCNDMSGFKESLLSDESAYGIFVVRGADAELSAQRRRRLFDEGDENSGDGGSDSDVASVCGPDTLCSFQAEILGGARRR